LALLLRYPVASVPLERDEGEYAYMAQRWVQGEVPYKDTFNQKPPAIFAIYVLFLTCVGNSPAAIHWGMQIYTLGTLALVYWLGKKLFSDTAGLVAASFSAFMTSAPCVLGQSANTEMAMLLPLTAGLAATLRAVEGASARWSFLAGVCAVAALLCKQVALLPVALYPYLMATEAGAGRLRMLGALVLGGVTFLALVLGYFVWNDAWCDFYDCVIGHNLSYAGGVPLAQYPLRLVLKQARIPRSAVLWGPCRR
jgi:4-amino-4-deoxy-L-arabinose transferase-like glycosyltransferase